MIDDLRTMILLDFDQMTHIVALDSIEYMGPAMRAPYGVPDTPRTRIRTKTGFEFQVSMTVEEIHTLIVDTVGMVTNDS